VVGPQVHYELTDGTSQIWVIFSSFCLYVAWLCRLSKMTIPRASEASDIRMTPRPGDRENPGSAVDPEDLENSERPDNQRYGKPYCAVGFTDP